MSTLSGAVQTAMDSRRKPAAQGSTLSGAVQTAMDSRRKPANLIILFIVFFCGCITTTDAQAPKEIPPVKYTENSQNFAPGEIIIKIKSGIVDIVEQTKEVPAQEVRVNSSYLKDLNQRYKLISIEKLYRGLYEQEQADTYVFRFPPEIDIEEAIAEYKKEPGVIYAQPNYIMHAQ